MYDEPLSRREVLLRGGSGFGTVALTWLLGGGRLPAAIPPPTPLASRFKPRPPRPDQTVAESC